MRTENIGEAIDVGAVFRKSGRPDPKWFMWGGRKYAVEKVESTWRSNAGEAPLLFFSVRAGEQVYELRFDQKTLRWALERVHAEG